MEILQLRILSYGEVEKDVTSVSTKVNDLWITLEEAGFMNPRRMFYFQKMLEELEKTMKDVELVLSGKLTTA